MIQTTEKERNRLIIIGNGFDLAHGLKTGYNNFFNWLWNRFIIYSTSEEDFSLTGIDTIIGKRPSIKKIIVTNNLFSIKFKYPREQPFYTSNIGDLFIHPDIEWPNTIGDKILIEYSSNNIILSRLLNKRHKLQRWEDIEKTFFNLLIEKDTDSHKYTYDIDILNRDLNTIRELFEEYLLSATSNNKPIISTNGLLGKIIREHAIEVQSSETLLLNFNYTNTAKNYIDYPEHSLSINHIHGELGNKDNPIVFGYGDERGNEYKEIELLDDNRYYEHFKSFAYLNTPKYNELLAFIDSKPYDIVIIGHSCGLTDRTLLNTLFEHENCIKIEAVYRKRSDGTDNFQEIVRNISRNIDDKKSLRALVKDKTNSRYI